VPLKAGTLNNFANSMAAAMERALDIQWQTIRNVPLPATGEEERRLLFVAIAQGVVRHLTENAETSFVVHDVAVAQDDNNQITSSGTTRSGESVTVAQDVDQANPQANKVQSHGESQRVEITTTPGDLL
jgi:hypothetical protein